MTQSFNQYSENKIKIWRQDILNQFNRVSSSCLRSHFVISLLAAWRNEIRKGQTSLKREAEKAMRNVGATVSFEEGSVIIGEERYILESRMEEAEKDLEQRTKKK